MRVVNASISIPLGNDKESAALAMWRLECLVKKEWEEAFVAGFNVGFPIGIEPAAMVKDMVKELQDSGILPKKEKWEGEGDGETG